MLERDVARELAPGGTLRAGINLSNFLLVSSRTADGGPAGVAPDMAAEIARRLGVGIAYVPFKTPGELADQAGKDVWDIGLIGAEPQRAAVMTFTAAYCEIEATYLVPANSPILEIADVDQPGVRVAVGARTAYGLWMERNVKKAELVWAEGLDGSFQKFVDDRCDALAGLRPRLISDVAKLPGARILPGRFMTVQQAVGTSPANTAAIAWLKSFVEEAKRSGFVAGLIERHGVKGLSVAPAVSG